MNQLCSTAASGSWQSLNHCSPSGVSTPCVRGERTKEMFISTSQAADSLLMARLREVDISDRGSGNALVMEGPGSEVCGVCAQQGQISVVLLGLVERSNKNTKTQICCDSGFSTIVR